MGNMASIPNFFLAFGLMSILKSDEAASAVKENADKLDALIDIEFPNKSEEIQEAIVAKILIPLARELMIEHPQDFINLLKTEASTLQNILNKESPYL